MIDVVEPAVRFCGRFHSDEDGKLVSRHRQVYSRACRILYWSDLGSGVGEGTLAGKLGMRITDPEWKTMIRRLSSVFNLIELLDAVHEGRRRVKLTSAGRHLVQVIIGERQLEGSRQGR